MTGSTSKVFFRLATSRFLSNFFELHCAPTYSPTEKLFLKEDTVPSDKHFSLFSVVELVTQGFPQIPHKNTLIQLGRKLVRLKSLDKRFTTPNLEKRQARPFACPHLMRCLLYRL